MVPASNRAVTIVRTERGLTIAGTRVTLYDIMDHLAAGRSPQLILNWLPLTQTQLEVALAYIEDHHAAIEAEYQDVLKTAAASQRYWDEKNRERFAQIAAMPPQPGQEALWQKLQAQKANHTAES